MKKTKIRPLHDRIIVRRLEEERKTASGIVIPDSATEKPDQGARWSRSARARLRRTAAFALWTSRRATGFCSGKYAGTGRQDRR